MKYEYNFLLTTLKQIWAMVTWSRYLKFTLIIQSLTYANPLPGPWFCYNLYFKQRYLMSGSVFNITFRE